MHQTQLTKLVGKSVKRSVGNTPVKTAYGRTSLALLTLAVLSACGGGGSTAEPVPVALGAALPEQGNYLALIHSSISISESERVGKLSVGRFGVAQGATAVSYRLVSGTALAGEDFRAAEGRLEWADGDGLQKDISFVVESDLRDESDEQFFVEIFNVEGMDDIGINDRASVTLQNSRCDAAVKSSRSDVQLTEPCYRLSGQAVFSSSAQVHVASGTAIIADPGASLTLKDTANLDIQGTEALPAVFKSGNEQAGSWQGINLIGNSVLHRVTYAEFAHAKNALTLAQGGFASLENNVFRDNTGAGISVPLTAAEVLGASNTFASTARGIELTGSSIAENQEVIIPAQSTHYTFANGLVNSGVLTLAPGTDIRMAADVNVLVLSSGSVNAVGTADQPISISGLEPRIGYWNGIQYVSSASDRNQFEHVTISHGGGDPARAGNIIIDGLNTRIALNQCVLTHSAGHGIVYDSSAFQVDLTDVSFEQNRLGDQSL